MTGVNRGSGATGGTNASHTVVPSSNFAAGYAVLYLATDNVYDGGEDSFSSISDTNGNTWTLQLSREATPGSVSNDGVFLYAFTTNQNNGLLTTGDTITINFTAGGPASAAYTLTEVSKGGGSITANGNVGDNNGLNVTSLSATTSSAAANTLVIGATAIEDDDAITADSDTTRGTWSTHQTATQGTNKAGVRISSQWKLVTSTGTQTYNTSWTAGSEAIVAVLKFT